MGLSNFTGNNNDDTTRGPIGMGVPFAGNAQSYDPMEYLTNYNEKFKNAGNILFRDEVVHQTLGTLIAKDKPNVILIGMAGVGKTKIVEDIAYKLANDDVILPDQLRGSTIYELPLSGIVAGSSFVGQLEEKIKTVIDFLADPANKAIMFIDEIHQLSSGNPIYDKIAQILKPALARGDIRTIGATTLQESNKLMDDPALNRRFSRIIVDEFTKEQTLQILEDSRASFIMHYGNKISIDPSILPKVVELADEYKPAGSHRPDNTLTLLDRSCGEAIVQRKKAEKALQNDPNMLQVLRSNPVVTITETQVRTTAIKLMTGNAKKNDFDVDKMRAALSKIKGQDNVVEELLKELQKHDLGLFPRSTPLSFMFTGKSGTGKTEVTKIIADELTGMKPIILNMTEYHASASINRIIGSPSGYVGSDSSQELPFDCLESNPYQIILLDEFEKADKSVQRLFMSALDEGYIKTNRGKVIDFSRAIIIATTNAGHVNAHKSVGFNKAENASSKKDCVDKLSSSFDVEMLNRFEDIITFNELSSDVYREIVASGYEREVERIRTSKPRIKLKDSIPDDDLDDIVKKTYVSDLGARPASRAVKDYIYSQLI